MYHMTWVADQSERATRRQGAIRRRSFQSVALTHITGHFERAGTDMRRQPSNRHGSETIELEGSLRYADEVVEGKRGTPNGR